MTDETLDHILGVLRQAGDRLVFVHCGSGNRVGGALLPFLMLDHGLEEEDAVDQAMRVGLRSAELMEWGHGLRPAPPDTLRRAGSQGHSERQRGMIARSRLFRRYRRRKPPPPPPPPPLTSTTTAIYPNYRRHPRLRASRPIRCGWRVPPGGE